MNIKFIILDVDGTLTDAGVYIDNNGIESKKFNTKDGLGVIMAQQKGVEFCIVTGRSSCCVEIRAKELNIKHVYQGIKEKKQFLQELFAKEGLLKENIAYIGDDLNDFDAMSLAQFVACPADACKQVKEISNYVSVFNGGQGAVRDVVEHLFSLDTL